MKGISFVLLFAYIIVLVIISYRSDYSVRNRLDSIENDNMPLDLNENNDKTLFERAILPTLKKIVDALSAMLPVSKDAEKQLGEKLQRAGIKMSARYYNFFQLSIYVTSVAFVFVTGTIQKWPLSKTGFYAFLCIYAIFALMRFSLTSKITKRKNQIEDEMPDILDLLSVSVVAGLGFDQALKYVVDRCEGVLIDELAIAQSEIALGRARSEALKKMSDRCGVDSLNSFVGAIIQAEVLGIPISRILQTQAANIRQMQKDKKEEQAAKLPVKILLPLVFLIFPTLLMIILGPAVPQIVEALGGM